MAHQADVEKYYSVYKHGWDQVRNERYARMREMDE